jgi:hypothetical protein
MKTEKELDTLIKEFNSSIQISSLNAVRLRNIGSQAISIWAANPKTLIDIIYKLKENYCKN